MRQAIYRAIDAEVELAKRMYPEWPKDRVHGAAICVEEAGELIQAALDHVKPELNHKEGDTVERMWKEAVQTAAMAIRFMEDLMGEGEEE